MYSPLRNTALGLSLPLFAALGLPIASSLLPVGSAFAQAPQTISGKITQESGEGLPGVTVLVKGTTNGVSTNADGGFTLNAPIGSTLVISAIGFVSQEVSVSGPTVNIKLATNTKALDEVVVVGYGTQRAEAVTGSVASISGENLREVPTANISQALQGRLPGVQISQTSSQPGASTQIRIRGTRSLTADNNPLIVLDGIPFPGSISDINPNDIQSVDILKDASATAIYGSRGANGVVLITTKGGKKGQKAQLTYDGFVGAKTLFAPFPMMNGPEFAALRKATGLYNLPSQQPLYSNTLDESDDVDTDWQKLLYRTGIQSNHNVGVTGGTENGRYNFNAGYYQEEGVIPTQQYTRYSVRGSLDQGVGRYVRLGFTTNSSYSLTEGSNVGVYGALTSSPLASPYNADGTMRRIIQMPLDQQWIATKDVIEANKDRWLSQSRNFASYNSLFGEFSMPGVDGLKYRINLGVNYRQSQGGSYTGEGINAALATNPSTASTSNSLTTDYTVENIVSYDRTLGGKHNINALALYSASSNTFNRSQINARDIPADAFQFYNLGRAAGEIIVGPNDQQYVKYGLLSYMGRVMYSYDDRYLFSATVRSDGSSRLAKGNQWKTYPAVSVGWNIAKESFMQSVSAVNMMKLRVGYGVTSNQAVDPYSTLGRLDARPYNFGPTGYQTGLFVNVAPNPSLGWEFSKTWNYALDFAVLKNRLSGTVEYYVTNTEDLLLGLPLPSTSGVGSYTANIGSTQNKGIELSLNGLILDNANGWTWEAGFNVYANRNKITSLAGNSPRDEANWWFVGKPINVVYDYEKIGLWQEEDPYRAILEPSTIPSATIGMIKVKYTGTYNDDGTPTRPIGVQDRQILDVNPNFLGGLNTRVAYKGFDLSVVGAFQNGGLLNSTIYGSGGYLNLLNGRRGNVKVDYWTPENKDAKYPRPGSLTSGDNLKYASTLGYFDASYLKVRSISLGYNFDNMTWLKNAGVNRLRLYATAQNPFVFFSPYKKESGMDPETNSNGNENAAVPLDFNLRRILTLGTNAPATRAFIAGLNLTF